MHWAREDGQMGEGERKDIVNEVLLTFASFSKGSLYYS